MDPRDTVRELVQRAIEKAGSARQLGIALGYNQAGIQRITRFAYNQTHTLSAADAERIRNYMSISTPAEVEDKLSQDESRDKDQFMRYPVVPEGHGASLTGRVNESDVAYASLPANMIRRMTGGRVPTAGLLTFASGDSMGPYIPDGCPVFIEQTDSLIDGARYALWLGDVYHDVIKRIRRGGNGAITLASDNRLVEALTLYPTEDAEVWRLKDDSTIKMVIRGRVLWPPDTGAAVFSQFAELVSLIGK